MISNLIYSRQLDNKDRGREARHFLFGTCRVALARQGKGLHGPGLDNRAGQGKTELGKKRTRRPATMKHSTWGKYESSSPDKDLMKERA